MNIDKVRIFNDSNGRYQETSEEKKVENRAEEGEIEIGHD